MTVARGGCTAPIAATLAGPPWFAELGGESPDDLADPADVGAR